MLITKDVLYFQDDTSNKRKVVVGTGVSTMSLTPTSRSSVTKQKIINFSISICLLNNLGNDEELSFKLSSIRNDKFKSPKPSNNESKWTDSRGD